MNMFFFKWGVGFEYNRKLIVDERGERLWGKYFSIRLGAFKFGKETEWCDGEQVFHYYGPIHTFKMDTVEWLT